MTDQETTAVPADATAAAAPPVSLADRAGFLSLTKRRFGTATLPVSGLVVRFRSLTEGENSALEVGNYSRDDDGRLQTDDERLADSRARFIVACLVDAEGNQLLDERDVERVKLLDAADTAALYDVLRDHTGLSSRPTVRNTVKN
jgi:hypothetical protein